MSWSRQLSFWCVHRQAQADGSIYANHHWRAAVSDLQALRCSLLTDGNATIGVGWRCRVAVWIRVQPVSSGCHRLYRARGRRGRIRRDYAALPQTGLDGTCRTAVDQQSRSARRHP